MDFEDTLSRDETSWRFGSDQTFLIEFDARRFCLLVMQRLYGLSRLHTYCFDSADAKSYSTILSRIVLFAYNSYVNPMFHEECILYVVYLVAEFFV
jgi:hypothetical protein